MQNYSARQIITAAIHLLLPFLIAPWMVEKGEEGFTLLQSIGLACFISAVIVIFIFGPVTRRVKTGRSFQTRSGNFIREYEERTSPGIGISTIHMAISLFHLAVPILSILFWLISL